MSLIVKLHKKDGRTILAVCDSDLLGKKIENEKTTLDLTSTFYKGNDMEDIFVGDLMRNADSINIVGKNAVKLAIQEGLIEEKEIKTVKDTPYAQASIIHDS